MKTLKGFLAVLAVVVMLVAVTSCVTSSGGMMAGGAAAGLGAIGAKIGMDAADGGTQAYHGRETIMLSAVRDDILDVIIEVGQSMKFQVTNLDKERKIIQIEAISSFAFRELLGKNTHIIILIQVLEGGRKLSLEIRCEGNWRTGTYQNATKFLEEFKAGLLQRLEK